MENQDMSVYNRILRAAAHLFAQNGYDGTTTREIVREAGASLSSVQLHFQSKEGIYREAVGQAMDRYYALQKPTMDEIEILEQRGMLHGDAAWYHLADFISKHAEWVFDEELHDVILLMNREMLEPNPLFDKVPDTALDVMHSIQKLCEAYVGTEDATWAKVLGHSVVMTLFGVANYPRVLSQITGKDITEKENALEIKLLIKEYLLTTLRSYLDVRKCDLKN